MKKRNIFLEWLALIDSDRFDRQPFLPSGNTITGIRKNHPGVTIKVIGGRRAMLFETKELQDQYMGVSKNRGIYTPKWMVYHGKPK